MQAFHALSSGESRKRSTIVAFLLAAVAGCGRAPPPEKAEPPSRPEAGARPPPPPPAGRPPVHRMSEPGLAKIRVHEAFRSKTYDDAAGNRTIGYGHMLRTGESFPNGITEAQGRELFRDDVADIVQPALDDVKAKLNQNQTDALGSFIYNAGPGSFRRSVLPAINAGDFEQAAAEMEQYTKGRNQRTGERRELNGLVQRRQAEIELFNTPTERMAYVVARWRYLALARSVSASGVDG